MESWRKETRFVVLVIIMQFFILYIYIFFIFTITQTTYTLLLILLIYTYTIEIIEVLIHLCILAAVSKSPDGLCCFFLGYWGLVMDTSVVLNLASSSLGVLMYVKNAPLVQRPIACIFESSIPALAAAVAALILKLCQSSDMVGQ